MFANKVQESEKVYNKKFFFVTNKQGSRLNESNFGTFVYIFSINTGIYKMSIQNGHVLLLTWRYCFEFKDKLCYWKLSLEIE